MTTSAAPSPLRHLDTVSVSKAAQKESRSRQTVLPTVSVFRWWARRTEAVVGGILDAYAVDQPRKLRVSDPFAGGGTIAIAAARRGHTVYAQDVNPWAIRGLATMFSLPSPADIRAAALELHEELAPVLGSAYTTADDGTMALLLRAFTGTCPTCGERSRHYPTSLASMTSRIDAGGDSGWVACPSGHLTLRTLRSTTNRCGECNGKVTPATRYADKAQLTCHSCSSAAHVSDWSAPTFEPALVGVEHDGVTVIRLADPHDRALADDGAWPSKPDLGMLPFGNETDRLRNRGFTDWQSLYPARQLYMISAALEAADTVAAGRPEMKLALTTAVIGTAELPGYLSRWDPRYLKPYEAVANHRFQPTLLPVEMNLWGAGRQGRSLNRRLEALCRASAWMEAEVGTRKVRVSWNRRTVKPADVTVVMGSSARVPVNDETFDLILTDPPYHDDVQYGELSEIFRCWLAGPGAQRQTTGDVSVGKRGCSTVEYRERLRRLFVESRRTLRSDGRMIISYANRDPDAWVALIGALHDAGFSAAGYTWVHSENESDHSKRTVRAATLDMLIDLVPRPVGSCFSPAAAPGTDQERFLAAAGKWVGLIGQLPDGWEEQVTNELASEAYVAA